MIYFIHDYQSNAVKIGKSDDVSRRKKEGETFNPNPLLLLGTMPGSRPEEKRTHEMFSAYKIPGKREWFRDTPEVMSLIRKLLLTTGTGRTVADELKRRNNCRYGLRGVQVIHKGMNIDDPHVILCAQWDKDSKLVIDICPLDEVPPEPFPGRLIVWASEIKLRPKPFGFIGSVPPEDLFLISDWPITCRCWISGDKDEEDED